MAVSVELDWSNPSDVDYSLAIIRRNTGTTAPANPSAGTFIANVTAPTATYLDSAVSAGTTYSYSVFTQDTSGNNNTTAVSVTIAIPSTDTTPPAAVTSASFTAVGTTSATLTWVDPSDTDLDSIVCRYNAGQAAPTSITAGAAGPIAAPGDRTMTVTGLAPSTQYAFALFSVDTSGNVNTSPVTMSTSTAGLGSGGLVGGTYLYAVAVSFSSGQFHTAASSATSIFVVDGQFVEIYGFPAVSTGQQIDVYRSLTPSDSSGVLAYLGSVTSGGFLDDGSRVPDTARLAPTFNNTGSGAGAGGGGFVLRGDWVFGLSYSPNDLVTYGGSAFAARVLISPSTVPPSDGTTWQLIAAGARAGYQRSS